MNTGHWNHMKMVHQVNTEAPARQQQILSCQVTGVYTVHCGSSQDGHLETESVTLTLVIRTYENWWPQSF